MIERQNIRKEVILIANVVFTIGWSDENATRPQLNATHKISKPKMDAVLKNLTGKITFATTAYQGEGGIDISENGDGSVIAVVDGQDATVYSDGGVLGIDSVMENLQNTAMFYQYNIREIDLHGLDMSKMTNASAMFSGCTSLVSISLSKANMSNVTNTIHMFSGCTALTLLNLFDIVMNNITDTNSMFYDCTSIKTIDLSSMNMDQVINAAGMFHGCESLTSLNLSNMNMGYLTNTYMMFKDCVSLIILDLSDMNMSHVTATDSMFENCTALKTCYAKIQADCDKLNNSSYKPSNVNFIVKPAA